MVEKAVCKAIQGSALVAEFILPISESIGINQFRSDT